MLTRLSAVLCFEAEQNESAAFDATTGGAIQEKKKKKKKHVTAHLRMFVFHQLHLCPD